MGKYKACKDNNDKSGRDFKSCEYYNEIDEILQKKDCSASTYTVSSTPLGNNKNSASLPLKNNTDSVKKKKIF